MNALNKDEFLAAIKGGQAVSHCEVRDDLCLHGQDFPQAVQVRDVVFRQLVSIEDAHFSKPVQFRSCRFEAGARMTCTSFHEAAHFSGCRFDGTAYFWRARFERDAHFDDVVVTKDAKAPGSVDQGELNLSWAWFRGPVDLTRARVHGPARFWRTLFLHDVRMDQALFADVAVFMGRREEVSVDLLAAGGAPAFDLLEERDLISPDPEVTIVQGGREFRRFAQLRVTSADQLQKRLGGPAVPAALVGALRRSFDEGAHPMFAAGHVASLCGIEVPSSGQIRLLDVDMRPCRLLGTRLAGALLSNVTWQEKRLPFGGGVRYVTADEPEDGRPLPGGEQYELQRLYDNLATTCEAQRDPETARGFRTSAWEAARGRQRGLTRAVTNWYRYLAVYGESAAVSLTWLALFVLVLFPLLYLLADYLAGEPASTWQKAMGRSLVKSLEVSAFIAEDQKTTALVPRLIAGVERILVASQVGLLLLSLKRLSPRLRPG